MPLVLFLLHAIASNAIQLTSPSRNKFLKGTVGRAAIQLPNSRYDPTRPEGRPLFGPKPAAEQIVVFHIGGRINHPLGEFAPGASETMQFFSACLEEAADRAKEYGCVGTSFWRGGERARENTTLAVLYFKSVEGLNAFAHAKVHREAWDWYHSWSKKTGYKHIGIYHETFLSAPGQYEGIYDNMSPVLLGSASFPVHNEQTGKDEYVLPLVDGNISALRSQFNRMGRTEKEATS